MISSKTVVVVGAGPAGLLTAALLARRGHQVSIVEKRLDPCVTSYDDKRSVNFTISPRGKRALDEIGAWPAIEGQCVRIIGRSVHKRSIENQQTYNVENPDDTALFSIKRLDFVRTLLKFVRANFEVQIHFGTEFQTFHANQVLLNVGGSTRILQADFIVGADGTNSNVAKLIRNSTSGSTDQWEFDWVYKRFSLDATQARKLELNLNFIHFFQDQKFLILALPNIDGTISCNLFYKNLNDATDSWSQAKSRFANASAKQALLVDFIDPQFDLYPASTIRSHLESNWSLGGSAVILGDAAHSVFHFYAQGLNSALEDTLIFADCLDHSRNLDECFETFQKSRIEDVQALRHLSKEHFFVLKDFAGSNFERMRNQLAQLILRMSGGQIPNTYRMVVRPEFRYSEAYQEIQRQKSMRDLLLRSLVAKKVRIARHA